MRFEGMETIRWETSDVRLAVWLAAYTPLTAGGMVAGDFSTLLEMTGIREERFEERELRFEGDRDNPARDVRRSDFRRLDDRR